MDNKTRNYIKRHCRKNHFITIDNFYDADLWTHYQQIEILIQDVPVEFGEAFENMATDFNFLFQTWNQLNKKHYLFKIRYYGSAKRLETFSRLYGIEYREFFDNFVPMADFYEDVDSEEIIEQPTKKEIQKASICQFITRFKEESKFFKDHSFNEFSEQISKSPLGKKYNLRKNDIIYAYHYANNSSNKETLESILCSENIQIKNSFLKQTIVRVIKFINDTYTAAIETL